MCVLPDCMCTHVHVCICTIWVQCPWRSPDTLEMELISSCELLIKTARNQTQVLTHTHIYYILFPHSDERFKNRMFLAEEGLPFKEWKLFKARAIRRPLLPRAHPLEISYTTLPRAKLLATLQATRGPTTMLKWLWGSLYLFSNAGLSFLTYECILYYYTYCPLKWILFLQFIQHFLRRSTETFSTLSFFLFIYLGVRLCETRREIRILPLELQAIVSCQMRVLGTELRCSRRAASAPNPRATSPVPAVIFHMYLFFSPNCYKQFKILPNPHERSFLKS